MYDWLTNPYSNFMRICLGSLRHQVAYEVRLHLRTNPAIREARPPLSVWLLKAIYGERGLRGFLIPYVAVVVAIFAAGKFMPEQWLSYIPSMDYGKLFETSFNTITAYFLAAQTVMIGLLFPIAVGLVTLIAQREDATSVHTSIQLYYHETLTYRIGVSSIALSIVLAVHLFWSAELAVGHFGYDAPPNFPEFALAVLHLLWLIINFTALWHFLRTSLDFVRPAERAKLLRRFASSVAIPSDISETLGRVRYAMIHADINTELNEDPSDDRTLYVSLSPSLRSLSKIEILSPKNSGKYLIDVRVRPLKWAVRMWWKRCNKHSPQNSRNPSRLKLVFPLSWGEMMPDEEICRRSGGVPLNMPECHLIKFSFRFGKNAP